MQTVNGCLPTRTHSGAYAAPRAAFVGDDAWTSHLRIPGATPHVCVPQVQIVCWSYVQCTITAAHFYAGSAQCVDRCRGINLHVIVRCRAAVTCNRLMYTVLLCIDCCKHVKSSLSLSMHNRPNWSPATGGVPPMLQTCRWLENFTRQHATGIQTYALINYGTSD